MKKVLEKDIQASIIQLLQLKHVFHYRNNSGSAIGKGDHLIRFGASGSPDIICVIAGRYVGLEVKRPGGKLRDSQIAFRDALARAGGFYFTVTSLDDAVDAIETIQKAFQK
jgi:hypothetical protein